MHVRQVVSANIWQFFVDFETQNLNDQVCYNAQCS